MSETVDRKTYLKSLLAVLPDSPGVYQYFNKEGTIIYIGKAKNLKKRVRSYFNKQHDNGKLRILVRKIEDIKHIVVDTESDALLLENNLIKKYQPRYNVMLKDDKTYPWIVIKNEQFPRVFMTRKYIDDGSKYYGPYSSVRMIRTVLDLVKHIFKIRTCSLNLSVDSVAKNKYKTCLEFHIGNCLAPCVSKQTFDDYKIGIEQVHHILKGNLQSVISHLNALMNGFAQNLEFEKALEIKQKIELIESYKSKSTVVNADINNVDVYSIVDDEKYAYVNYFKVANGAIIQSHTIEIKKKLDESKKELLMMAIADLRQSNIFGSNLANEIIVPFELNYKIPNVKITVPQRGDKFKLLELSERNVKYYRLEKLKQKENVDPLKNTKRILKKMQDDLRLKEPPAHIECFDNSNLQGSYPVSSCVVFKNAKPSKKDYRHFNVKTVVGIDDFATMEEIVYRRYKRLLDENASLPQLIIIDGGKGQLGAALKSLGKLGLENKIAIIGIAKRLEELFFPNDPIPLYLNKNSETLKIIQQARDEAHRFGVTFHKLKRGNDFLKSELHSIDGVGEKTAELLLQKFKSVKKISLLPIDSLKEVVGEKKAEIIFEYFKTKIS